MNKELEKIIAGYRDDIIADLTKLVAIDSVAGEPNGENPFGDKAAEALKFILGRAAEMGFEVVNVGNAAGHAEYGAGETYAGVLTHVDVVPAGEGWDTDPFTLTIKDGRMYGRGVADDKGAAVVSLYCLKALKELGITGKRRIRCIFGAGEETGMPDMEMYFAEQPLPEIAFTPDSDYPVCNREKGILQFEVSCPVSADSAISSFRAGNAINCVAEKTEAEVAVSLEESVRESVVGTGCECSVDGMTIRAKGKSAHAMCPQNGINSAAAVFNALRAAIDEPWLNTLCTLLCSDNDGSGLGVACCDEPSGALTFNLGFAALEQGKLVLGCDIRYPVTANGEGIIRTIGQTLSGTGFELNILEHKEPIYLPDDDKLVRMLCDCYTDVMGEEGTTYSTGGGTYARSMANRGIAFGPQFADSPTHIHEANETLGLDDLDKHMKLCCEAMFRMMTL